MRITVPRLITLSAVRVLPVACGSQEPAASSSTPTVVKATATPSPTPTAVEVTKATFRVEARLTEKGAMDPIEINANVRIKGDVTDLAVDDDGDQLVRIGETVYLEDAELTGNKNRAWAKLDLNSDDPGIVIAAGIADVLVSEALFHQVIGGAAHATSFQRGGQVSVGGVDAQEYTFMVDLKKGDRCQSAG